MICWALATHKLATLDFTQNDARIATRLAARAGSLKCVNCTLGWVRLNFLGREDRLGGGATSRLATPRALLSIGSSEFRKRGSKIARLARGVASRSLLASPNGLWASARGFQPSSERFVPGDERHITQS